MCVVHLDGYQVSPTIRCAWCAQKGVHRGGGVGGGGGCGVVIMLAPRTDNPCAPCWGATWCPPQDGAWWGFEDLCGPLLCKKKSATSDHSSPIIYGLQG